MYFKKLLPKCTSENIIFSFSYLPKLEANFKYLACYFCGILSRKLDFQAQ